MSKSWDSRGIAFDPETWRAALRILKPGGHLLAFGGTRTFHRLTCAIEDAGFEIRDCLSWNYGSGFPKSLDVSKAIDKAAGAEREVIGEIPDRWTQKGDVLRFATDRPQESVPVTGSPATPNAQRWQGWGTALKPSWEPIILARKPLSGTVAATVLEHGTGALNIDDCRIGTTKDVPASPSRTGGSTYSGNQDGTLQRADGRSSGFNPNVGRWPANIILSHDERCVCVGERIIKNQTGHRSEASRAAIIKGTRFGTKNHQSREYADPEITELWACVPGCPVRMLDDQSGEIGNKWKKNYGELYAKKGIQYKGGSFGGGGYLGGSTYLDRGGASRFFYCPKASTKERNLGLEDFDANIVSDGDETPKKNIHTTVKPLKLMRWLVRLVTPPNGIILDPFNGSGTTGIAAILEGFNFIGIDMEAEYCKIAEARLAYWSKQLGKDDG
jgi:DNA modification methylase